MAANNPYRRVTSLTYWLISVVVVVAGLILLFLAGTSAVKRHEIWANLANQVGGLAIASVALASIWELFGRRSFFHEMLEVHRLKSDVTDAALESIGTDYTKIEWAALITTAKHLDIFSAWANTWRNQHLAALTILARKTDSKIRVFLPDPNDRSCVESLAARFNYGKIEAKNKILEARGEYKDLDDGRPTGRIEIWTTSVFRVFTLYRIDDRFIATLYHHEAGRRASVPVIVCREGGTLASFFATDMEAVHNASRKIYP